MAIDKFQIRYGRNDAPYKIISFISASCTYCAEFMLKDLGKIQKLAKTGRVQFAFFPYLRSDFDEIVFANIIASQKRQDRTFLIHAKTLLNKAAKDRKGYLQLMARQRNQLGFSFKELSKIRNSKTILANLKVHNHIARHSWGIRSVPASAINGYVLKDPTRGRLVREVNKLIKY